jgi:hypothetical protein
MISSATLTGTRLLPSWSRRCLLGGASPLEEKKRTATKMNGLFDSVYSASYVFCEEEKLDVNEVFVRRLLRIINVVRKFI